MALPSRIYDYYINLDTKISWRFRECGVIKGILNYYYRDWALFEDAHILMIAGLSSVRPGVKKEVEVLSEMDFIEDFFFGIGSFYKRWSCSKWEAQRELTFYIDLLAILVSKGLFGSGILMTPVITQFSFEQKTYLAFFLDYDIESKEFAVLIIEENDRLVLKKLGRKQIEKVESLDYLAVELPTSSMSEIHVIKRGLFYSNLQSEYITHSLGRNKK
jgi:hypothetical protein